MAEIQFDDQVDITDKVCPLTFVKAKVAIEELDDGRVIVLCNCKDAGVLTIGRIGRSAKKSC